MNSKKRGFTFIEIALVLGIAGLIFLMAFIALPNLWASERDADRRATVMGLISSLKNYQTNNSRGAMHLLAGDGPEVFSFSDARGSSTANDWKAFVREYVDSDFGDPSNDVVKFYVANCLSSAGESLNVAEPCAYKADLASANANGGPTTSMDYTFYIAIGATCDGDQLVKSSSSRSIAALYILERSGRYCYNT